MADLSVERRGDVQWITITREDRRNALSFEVIDGIRDAIHAAEADPATRAIVVTGAGDKAFCAGADLKPGTGSFEAEWAATTSPFGNLLRRARDCTLPLVARVNGHCMAGGMGLLAMCDMAVSADHGLYALPETKVGVFPMQVMAVFQHLIPRRRLMEMAITAESFTAAEALDMGLVNYVVPLAELDAKTDWLLARITDKSPTAIKRGKFAMRRIEHMSFDQAIAYMEPQIATLALTEDAAEGRAAFNEKRKPDFPGR